ncbi:VanZ family protein [Streptomyces sp. TR06-5]|uniref:VanZ family protein n=1 Tax=unclassified Streptomyces TaxID=2593676 RepID=UPI00399FDE3B
MHAQDPGGTRRAARIRAAALVLLWVHLLTVGWLTLRPRSVPWVSPSNLRPFATIQADLAAGPLEAMQSIGGGLLLLAPVGVLFPLATGRLHRPPVSTALRTVSAGVLFSLGCAGLRSVAPGAVVTLDAVMLNAAGIALAHLVLYLPLRSRLLGGDRHRKDPRLDLREEGMRGRTPRSSRVGVAP